MGEDRKGRHSGLGDSRGMGRGPMSIPSQMALCLSVGIRGQDQGMWARWSSQCGGSGREEPRLVKRALGSREWF